MNARITSIFLFSSMARENLHRMARVMKKMEQLKNGSSAAVLSGNVPGLDKKIVLLREQSSKYAVSSIVFSAIAIEAYIYDYAARHLSDSYVQQHIDRLDPVSKWVVVPRLVLGRDFPDSRKWLPILKNLIRQRNLIVHNKSMEVPNSNKEGRSLFDKLYRAEAHILETAKHGVQLLDTLSAEMIKFDPDEEAWVQSHLLGK